MNSVLIDDEVPNLIEPISMEEIRKYVGFDKEDTREDVLLKTLVSSQRALLEELMERIIVEREFVAHPQRDGCVRLLPSLQEVMSITYRGKDKQEKEVLDFDTALGDAALVEFCIDEPFSDIKIRFRSGFGIIPETIKDGIKDLVKARYERTTVEDVLSAVRVTTQKYWKEHI